MVVSGDQNALARGDARKATALQTGSQAPAEHRLVASSVRVWCSPCFGDHGTRKPSTHLGSSMLSPLPYIGPILDPARNGLAKCLKSLALPTGLEPVFPP